MFLNHPPDDVTAALFMVVLTLVLAYMVVSATSFELAKSSS